MKTKTLLLSILFSLLSVSVFADIQLSQGKYKITVSDDYSQIVINGFSSSEYQWSDDALVIPDNFDGIPVVGIGENAFRNSSFTSVVIPETVTFIDESAFSCCYSLESITIPDSVTSLGYETFYNCSRLKTVTLSKNLKQISSDCFRNCSSITAISFSEGLETIGSYAFSGCSKIRSIVIPASVKTIGQNAFSDCVSISSVEIKNPETALENAVFQNCSAIPLRNKLNLVQTYGQNIFNNN